jgi:hypothetical protein
MVLQRGAWASCWSGAHMADLPHTQVLVGMRDVLRTAARRRRA